MLPVTTSNRSRTKWLFGTLIALLAAGAWLSPTPAWSEGEKITVGDRPLGIAVTPDGARALVGNFEEGNAETSTLTVLGLAPLTHQAEVTVGRGASAVVVTPDGAKALVVNVKSNTVSFVDLHTLNKIADVGVGTAARDISLSPDGRTALVVNSNLETAKVALLDVANNASSGSEIAVPGSFATAVAAAPDGRSGLMAYFENSIGPVVLLLDLVNNQATSSYLKFRSDVSDIVFTADGNIALAAVAASDSVSFIDARALKVVDTVAVGDRPTALAITPDGRRAVVVNFGGDSLSIIDLQSRTKLGQDIPVGNGPAAVAISPDGTTAYVANSEEDTVSLVDLTAIAP